MPKPACTFAPGLFFSWERKGRPAVVGLAGEKKLGSVAIAHFTGFGSRARKLQCAKAEALLPPPPGQRPTLVYRTPLSATPAQQAQALGAAARLGAKVGAALALPLAVAQPRKGGEPRPVPLCRLLDVEPIPLGATVAPPGELSLAESCELSGTPRDALELARAAPLAGTACVSFASLLRYFAAAAPPIHALYTCDPWSPALAGNHACVPPYG